MKLREEASRLLEERPAREDHRLLPRGRDRADRDPHSRPTAGPRRRRARVSPTSSSSPRRSRRPPARSGAGWTPSTTYPGTHAPLPEGARAAVRPVLEGHARSRRRRALQSLPRGSAALPGGPPECSVSLSAPEGERALPGGLLPRFARGPPPRPVDQGDRHAHVPDPRVARGHRGPLRPDVRAEQRSGLRAVRLGRLLLEGDRPEQRRRPRVPDRLGIRPALLPQERAAPAGPRADPRRRRRKPPRSRALHVRRRLPGLLDLRPPLAGVQPRGLRDLHRSSALLFLDMLQRGGGGRAAPAPVSPVRCFPRLIQIGSFYLPTYGVVLAIAYLVGIWMLRRKARDEGLPEQKVFDLSPLHPRGCDPGSEAPPRHRRVAALRGEPAQPRGGAALRRASSTAD